MADKMTNKGVCIVPSCTEPMKARGYCSSHYCRWRRHGNPLAGRFLGTASVNDMSIDDLKTLIAYDQDTGLLTWRVSVGPRSPGDVAGSKNGQGYLQVWVMGKRYQGHRIAFAMHHGRWPDGSVDHINHDRLDNRIVNLREATEAENKRNSLLRSDNTSGFKGVCENRKRINKWQASIKVNKKLIFLGNYPTPELAAIAYDRAAIRHHGEFACTNFPAALPENTNV